MKLSKPYLLFAAPRSGSTPIYYLFEELFANLYGLEGREEFFNWTMFKTIDTNDGLFNSPQSMSLRLDEIRPEALRRVALLEKYPKRYFFKLLSNHTMLEVLPWLSENYHWLFLERKDILEQLLSYLKVRCQKIWYEPIPKNLSRGSLLARREHFEEFESVILKYYKVKRMIPAQNKTLDTIYYEDYCATGPLGILRKTNFPISPSCTFSKAASVPKQSHGNKISIFSNAEEILGWYKNSFLAQLSSI